MLALALAVASATGCMGGDPKAANPTVVAFDDETDVGVHVFVLVSQRAAAAS